MTYSFLPFLERASSNWYADDLLLQRLLARCAPERGTGVDEVLSDWGARVAGRLRILAEESARPENHPRLRHFDAHNRRIDEVVLPASTLEGLAEVEGSQRLAPSTEIRSCSMPGVTCTPRTARPG